MAKKSTGIKKGLARVAAGVTAAGTVIVTIAGLNIYSRLQSRPDPEHTTDKTTNTTTSHIVDTPGTTPAFTLPSTTYPPATVPNFTTVDPNPHPIVTEPSIVEPDIITETTPFYTTVVETTAAATTTAETTRPVPTTGGFVPEPTIKVEQTTETTRYQPIPVETTTTPEKVETQLGVEFIDVLSKLTEMSKEYLQDISDSSKEPNITVTGINSIKIAPSSHTITILGELKAGNTVNNYVATLKNPDKSLKIYSLNGEISENELIDALNEFLDSIKTEFEIELMQHFSIASENKIIKNVLQERLNQLNSSQDNAKEINYVNKLMDHTDKLKLSVLLNNRVKTEDGYKYDLSIIVIAGKYVYCGNLAITSEDQLTSKALAHIIENELSTNLKNCNISMIPASSINQALYLVNYNNEQNFNK